MIFFPPWILTLALGDEGKAETGVIKSFKETSPRFDHLALSWKSTFFALPMLLVFHYKSDVFCWLGHSEFLEGKGLSLLASLLAVALGIDLYENVSGDVTDGWVNTITWMICAFWSPNQKPHLQNKGAIHATVLTLKLAAVCTCSDT